MLGAQFLLSYLFHCRRPSPCRTLARVQAAAGGYRTRSLKSDNTGIVSFYSLATPTRRADPGMGGRWWHSLSSPPLKQWHCKLKSVLRNWIHPGSGLIFRIRMNNSDPDRPLVFAENYRQRKKTRILLFFRHLLNSLPVSPYTKPVSNSVFCWVLKS